MSTSRSPLAAVLACALVSACGGDTGVVIEVTRDVETTPADIEELRFFVGLDEGVTPDGASTFVDDYDPDVDVVALDGRDLAEDPFKLLLERGDVEPGMDMMVAVVGLKGGEIVGFGALEQRIGFVSGSVTKWTITLEGNAGGRVDVTDTGCLIWSDEAGTSVIASPDDQDCDGDVASVDCDDNDPTVGPGQQELCANEIDDDCDDVTDEEVDHDGDQVTNCTDCDDDDMFTYPGAEEKCDGVDNDCNGVCDDGPLDVDGDDYTICDRVILDDGTCSDPDPSLNDCAPEDPTSFPGAEEKCDGFDNNCNLRCDEGFDADSDQFTACGSVVDECAGTTDEDIDCAPDDGRVFPGNQEFCDGVDNNCDGVFFPASNGCYVQDSGECMIGTRICNDAKGGGWSDCVPMGDGALVPDALCSAYDACDNDETVADPLACANEAAPAQSFACTVFHTGATELCPNREVELPTTVNQAACIWRLFGTKLNAHYDVGLRALGSPGSAADAPSLNVCNVVFAVNAALDAPPVPDSFFAWQRVDLDSAQLLRIDVEPMAVAKCPPQGLSCTGLAPPEDTAN